MKQNNHVSNCPKRTFCCISYNFRVISKKLNFIHIEGLHITINENVKLNAQACAILVFLKQLKNYKRYNKMFS